MVITTVNGIMGIPINGKPIVRITIKHNFPIVPLIAVQKRGFSGKNIKVVKRRSVSLHLFPLISMNY